MKIENLDVWNNFNQTGYPAVCFDLDGVAHFEWLNSCDGYWIVERIDSNLKHNGVTGNYELIDIFDELDRILEDLR